MQVSVKPLAPLELAAWRGLLRAHARLVRALDADLEASHGITLTAYEVLLLLHEAPGRRLRMSDLAESALLSQSGMTRLVDRLVGQGLVERVPCEDDRRGLFAHLTPAGLQLFRRARSTHLAGVRERFLRHFSAAELGALGEQWERIEA
jgi:DNA-binding MarR family transcriptional regulator